jgi:hypothetical protein
VTNGPIKIAEPIRIDVKVANLHTVALKKGRWNTGDSILVGGKRTKIDITVGVLTIAA